MRDKKLTSYRFSEDTLATIDSLREDMQLSSNSDVVRKALLVLNFVIEQQKQGGTVVVINKDPAVPHKHLWLL